MKKVILCLVAALGFSILLSGVAFAGYGAVIDTSHDLGSPGNPACKQCHIPHDAKGSYLWARKVGTTFTGIKALCYSCHDGSVTSYGTYAFDTTKEQHKDWGGDCSRCHNPHDNTNGKFVAFAIAANLCANSGCHFTKMGGTANHKVDVQADGHVPTDGVWNPNASPADYSGTRLWNLAGTTVQIPPTSTGYLKCLTCHTPHGGTSGTKLLTMPYSSSTGTNSPICQNCHQ